MTVKVIADRHRHTAILYDQTDSHVKVIAMQGGELVCSKMDEDVLTSEWGEMAVDPWRAAATYLDHPGGVSPKARDILTKIKLFGEI